VGKLIAVCDQTTAVSHIQFVAVSTGVVKFTLPGACSSSMAHLAAWASTGKTFYVVPAKGPIAIYTIPS
jgi:hypothetical protein